MSLWDDICDWWDEHFGDDDDGMGDLDAGIDFHAPSDEEVAERVAEFEAGPDPDDPDDPRNYDSDAPERYACDGTDLHPEWDDYAENWEDEGF